jgi:hypothetical protein
LRDEIKAAVVCIFLLSLVIVVFAVHNSVAWKMRPIPLASPVSPPDDYLPPAQFDQFVDRYGPPTFEEQSPRGLLSPPVFTKWLDYEPEHLRVAFIAAESTETASGKRWVLISFIDAQRTQPVSAAEAARRLSSRRK